MNTRRHRPTRRYALHRLGAALAFGLTGLGHAPAGAAPPVAHWTVIDLGSLPGSSASNGFALNNAGQVAGTAYFASARRAVLFKDGVVQDLGTLGGDYSDGQAINAAGEVAGTAYLAGNSSYRAFRTIAGVMTDLGTLNDRSGGAYGINDANQVAGYSNLTSGSLAAVLYDNTGTKFRIPVSGTSVATAISNRGEIVGDYNAGSRAFSYRDGILRDLGQLPGATLNSATAVNDSGQVAGYSSVGVDHRAFLYDRGAMVDLGTLGSTSAFAFGLNEAGLVVGQSAGASGPERAFLYSRGAMADLNTFNGVAGSPLQLTKAADINDAGQITGTGLDGLGQNRAFLMTLDTTVWDSASGGAWDSPAGWSHGIAPNRNTEAFIDVVRSLTVTGPSGDVDVKRLTIGGDITGNNGIATLYLNGGTINVLGSEGLFTTITTKGVVAGDGTLIGDVVSYGTVRPTNLRIIGAFGNLGLVTGSGRLNANLDNGYTGQVRSGAGEHLHANGAWHFNQGVLDISGGGSQQYTGSLHNNAGARILINNGVLRLDNGMTNTGQVQISFGGATVYGAVTTMGGGKVLMSGNSESTFFDAIEVEAGGELRVSAGSTAVFFGPVQQRTGALFSGTGTKFYEGGLSIGASPGAGYDGGDVNFGADNVYLAEIGGTAAGSGFDFYSVTGALNFGGTLKLVSWDGFTGQAGQSFDLFDWGSASGRFSLIDGSGLLLAPGAVLDTSRLYVDGTLNISAVPEPAAGWLALLGLGGVLCRARTRRSAARGSSVLC